ncbi:MAG TPA: hypothetical protein VMP41_14640 [Acidimicrobiales bacterium]|nr:hypothetical protein [Acidimicrobiales bacterium]
MPIDVTPFSGLSDHIDEAPSHTGRGVDDRMVTNESLRPCPPWGQEPDDVPRIGVAKNVLHHYEKTERWGSRE